MACRTLRDRTFKSHTHNGRETSAFLVLSHITTNERTHPIVLVGLSITMLINLRHQYQHVEVIRDVGAVLLSSSYEYVVSSVSV